MSDNTKSKLGIWLSAIRLRTLPLSVAGILAGSALAYRLNSLKLSIFIPAIITTLFLQILSNLANDYGDAQKGTDGENRIGPQRMVQSGHLSLPQIQRAIALTAVLALISGLILLYNSFGPEQFIKALIFFFIGIFAIWAAIKYTVGKTAYGYYGLGDLFVFFFFGFISVCGSFYLYTKSLSISAILQSITIGLFSTGVLHLNNMRDRESDSVSGKRTIAVKLGKEKSLLYFYFLLITAILASLADISLTALHMTELIEILIVIPIILILIKVSNILELKDYNNFLKPLALSTFLYSILLFLSFVL